MRKIPNLRWRVVALLFLATAISYVDRQTLAVVAPTLRDDLGISNFGYARILSSFLIAYTVMQPVTGWVIDRIGTRKGFAIIMLWWSASAMLHGFGRGVMSFSILRFLLGAGEAGSWAACVRVVSEWFPKQERGLANGIWGVGTSVGLVVSVPLVAWITLWLGWRAAFVLTGLVGIVWAFVWWTSYQLPEQHPRITDSELELIKENEPVVPSSSRIPYLSLLRSRSVWAVILSRMFADPNSWFYHYWLPEYLKRGAGFSLAEIGRYAWIPFATQGLGILLGGWFSDRLIRRDFRVVNARLIVMSAGMIMMSAGAVAAFPFPIPVTFTGISVATFGFGLWAPNMMSLCGEAFPRDAVGSVTGLSGMGAGLGGLALTLSTGWLVDHFGYSPVFILVGTMPLVAILVLYTLLEKED